MADGIDAFVNGMQESTSQSVLDRSSPEPDRDQLAMIDYPVLLLGDLRDDPIDWAI